MNDTEKMRIIELRNSRRSYSQIAAAMGMSVNTIKTFCNRNGLGGVAAIIHPKELIFCKYCGNSVTQTPGRKAKRFCNSSCRNSYWNAHLSEVKRKAYYEYICPTCGKLFTEYGNSKRKYCSHACYVKGRWGA